MQYKVGSPSRVKVCRSNCNEAPYNIAYEAHLTETVERGEIILFLWQNDHTIVVGRNQNPWKECLVKKFEEDNGRVIRRLSGGGAVYHDMGNLNFSIIAHRDDYNVAGNVEIIKDAMNKLGYDATFSGKNDLMIKGRKFSGHAFFEIGEKRCHHGAILVNTNLTVLSHYLTPSKLKMRTKSVDSVRARVMNLSDMNSDIHVNDVADKISEAFLQHYDEVGASKSSMIVNKRHVSDSAQKWLQQMNSWEWTFSESPKFDISLQDRFDWGTVEIGMVIDKGRIQSFQVFTDSNEVCYFQNVMRAMTGSVFEKKIVLRTLESVETNRSEFVSDLKSLLEHVL